MADAPAIVACGSVDLPAFDASSTADLGTRWRKWVRTFCLLASGRGVGNPGQKRDLLLGLAGEGVQDIHDTLVIAAAADGGPDIFVRTLNALNAYFQPQVNVPFERSVFRKCAMEDGESVALYVTRLKRLAASCDFHDADECVRDQVIDKVLSQYLRRKFLEEGGDLTLVRVLELSRAAEAMDSHLGAYRQHEQQELAVNRVQQQELSVHRVQQRASGGNSQYTPRKGNYTNMSSMVCFRCKRTGHRADSPNCIALDKECRDCGCIGHFSGSRFCKHKTKVNVQGSKTRVSAVGEESEELFTVLDDQEQESGTVSTLDTVGSAKVVVDVAGLPLTVVVDSGAASNLAGEDVCRLLQGKGISLERTAKRLFAYGSKTPLDLAGEMDVTFTCNGVSVRAILYIFRGKSATLLGLVTATKLGVLCIQQSGVGLVSRNIGAVGEGGRAIVGEGGRAIGDLLMEKYPACFTGVGKLKDQTVSLHIDKSITPVAQPVRRIPFGHRELAKEKLDQLVAEDIVERVEGPTPWVSPLVTVAKDDGKDVRICVDMRCANKAIKRERHPIPTLKEILYNLNGAKVFSKVDLKLGFHQLELDVDSRSITTFVTPWGLFRYKRLSLGISSAPEVYQHVIQTVLLGLCGTFNYADDMIVGGSTRKEHDERLEALLRRLSEVNLTLNPKKCQFGLGSVTFLGHVISAEGVSVDPRKVESIQSAREPTNVSEVRGLISLIQYVGVFLKDLANMAEPINWLLRKGVVFSWGNEQRKAFARIKSALSDCDTLAFFDSNAPTRVVADASPTAVGAVLCQTQEGVPRVVAYGHRSLTPIERRYSQTEREALGLVWACEHFRLYLLGTEFELVTDHRPLEFIFNRANSKPSPRIERWALRLMAFSYHVVYVCGEKNIADPLSRLSGATGEVRENVADAYIRQVTQAVIPRALSWTEICGSAEECPETVVVRKALRDGDWNSCPAVFRAVKDELAEFEGVVLRGSRLLVPMKLRDVVLKLAHEGHQGIVKTKLRLRTKVWWPGIDRQAEAICRTCLSCQCVGASQPPEPLVTTRLPETPWVVVSMDLMGPLPSGESVLVCVDYYSRYFEVAVLRVTTAEKVIAHCAAMFGRWGFPEVVRTDNGRQFSGTEFQRYLTTNGIQWISTTPLWPQANGEVERQNRTLLKCLKIATLEKRNMQEELQKFLMAYRSTPHSATGVTPFEAMTGRKMRTKLPGLRVCQPSRSEGRQDEVLRDKDALSKIKRKEYADERRGAVCSDLEVGDRVLVPVPEKSRDKLAPNFEPDPYIVVRKTGSDVTCRNSVGRQLRRNSSCFKRLQVAGDGPEGGNLLPEPMLSEPGGVASDSEVQPPVASRPKRERNLPTKFNDFVLVIGGER